MPRAADLSTTMDSVCRHYEASTHRRVGDKRPEHATSEHLAKRNGRIGAAGPDNTMPPGLDKTP